MKRLITLLAFVFLLSLSAAAQTNDLTYQGRLVDGSSAANGNYDFIFKLFDDPTDPAAPQIGTDQIRNDVAVSSGVFTVVLGFGSTAFDGGGERYLEIYVRPGASTGPYALLTPRQRITSAPFSIKSSKADTLSNQCVMCVNNGHIFSVDGAKITGTVSNAANATTATNVSGIVAIANGGTGSSTKNFVDLSTNQTIGGVKTFGHAAFVNPFAPITISGSLTVEYIVTAEQFHGSGDGLVNVPGTFLWQSATGPPVQAEPNKGYVATNDAQVVVTLPSGIGVGQTIRVTGPGSGGWRIAQNDGQAVIGVGINLIPPTWTAHDSNREWSGLASSSNGFKLVGTVSGSAGRIYTSDDAGASWIPRESTRDWRAVASSADGTKLAAVAFSEPVFTSTNSGQDWTPRSVGGAFSIASSADGTKLVTGTPSSNFQTPIPGYIHTSTNSGVNWTSLNINQSWWGFASSADGTKLVATTQTPSTGKLYTSPDSGATWTQVPNMAGRFGSVASSADGTKLVAAGDTTRIWTSIDSGATWTPHESVRIWNAVASSADGTRLAAVAEESRIYISIDSGATWIPVESVRNWSAVAISGDGTRIVAAARLGQIYTSMIPANLGVTTTPGTAGYLVGSQNSSIELQYVGNGKFLPISYAGTITGY